MNPYKNISVLHDQVDMDKILIHYNDHVQLHNDQLYYPQNKIFYLYYSSFSPTTNTLII